MQTITNDHEGEHRKRMQKVTCIFASAVEKIHGKDNIVQVSATKVREHMNQEALQEETNQINQPVDELTQHGNNTNNTQHSDADKEKVESENLEELRAEGKNEVLDETANKELAEEVNASDKERRRQKIKLRKPQQKKEGMKITKKRN